MSNTDRIDRNIEGIHQKLDTLLERTATQQVTVDAVKDLPNRVTRLETKAKGVLWGVGVLVTTFAANLAAWLFSK